MLLEEDCHRCLYFEHGGVLALGRMGDIEDHLGQDLQIYALYMRENDTIFMQ